MLSNMVGKGDITGEKYNTKHKEHICDEIMIIL